MHRDGDVNGQEFLDGPTGDIVCSLLPMSRFRLDLQTKVFSFDRRFGPMIGMEPFEAEDSQAFLQRLEMNDRWFFSADLSLLRQDTESIYKRDIRICNDSGVWYWFEIRASFENSVVDPGRFFSGLMIDISDRKCVKVELSESERWFKEVLEESPHALYRIDWRTGRFDYVSMGFARALGVSREEILNMPYSEFIKQVNLDDLGKLRADFMRQAELKKGSPVTVCCEFRYKRTDGRYIWLDDTFTVVFGPDGQVAYQVGFGSVIEERKRLEEELRQSHDHLEERVRERTTELSEANRRLESMMTERRELEKKLLEISERERRFIGRELHDGLCQQIAGVMCMSDAIHRKLAAKKIAEETELGMMRDFLHDAVQQTRTLARGLCPLALDPQAIGGALATLASQTSYLYKIDCRYDGQQTIAVADPDAALHLYRISQEAIQNAIRHGAAKQVRIGFETNGQELKLLIENDGKPLPAKATMATKGAGGPEGLGLKLIDYRSSLLGGSWKISNRPGGKGVRVEVLVAFEDREVTNAVRARPKRTPSGNPQARKGGR